MQWIALCFADPGVFTKSPEHPTPKDVCQGTGPSRNSPYVGVPPPLKVPNHQKSIANNKRLGRPKTFGHTSGAGHSGDSMFPYWWLSCINILLSLFLCRAHTWGVRQEGIKERTGGDLRTKLGNGHELGLDRAPLVICQSVPVHRRWRIWLCVDRYRPHTS